MLERILKMIVKHAENEVGNTYAGFNQRMYDLYPEIYKRDVCRIPSRLQKLYNRGLLLNSNCPIGDNNNG